jgi:hypothetical protein
MKTTDFEDRLDEIRVNLYEQTRNMSISDIVIWEKENAKKLSEEFRIEIRKHKTGILSDVHRR